MYGWRTATFPRRSGPNAPAPRPTGRILPRMSRPSDQRRAAVIVIDACGAGALPDAADYGDPPDANTLAHVAEGVGGLHLPTLERLGVGSIVDIEGGPPPPAPVLHGRLHPLGPGKDSTTGHWELMGVVAERPLPTYPNGFPDDVVARLEDATGLRFCANKPADGIAIIEELGEHHLKTGEVILYTSADSVLQLAAHDDVLPEHELHAACEAAREVMRGEHASRRVIARPFTGPPGDFTRPDGSPAHRGASAGARAGATTRSSRRVAPTSSSCRTPGCRSRASGRCRAC